jgi:hypothetical protein
MFNHLNQQQLNSNVYPKTQVQAMIQQHQRNKTHMLPTSMMPNPQTQFRQNVMSQHESNQLVSSSINNRINL